MELSPRLYHWFVRPEWFSKLYMDKKLNTLLRDIDFENKSVLDFGCGIGTNCSFFDSNNYMGVDCDRKRIAYARHRYKHYHFKAVSELPLPIGNNAVDYIFIMAVLHHIAPENILIILKEFHRIIKADGKIFIIEPYLSQNYPLNNWFMKTFDKGKYLQNEEGYLNIFKNQGYKTKAIKQFKKCMYNELFFIASRF